MAYGVQNDKRVALGTSALLLVVMSRRFFVSSSAPRFLLEGFPALIIHRMVNLNSALVNSCLRVSLVSSAHSSPIITISFCSHEFCMMGLAAAM
jgi:hypothetical protein